MKTMKSVTGVAAVLALIAIQAWGPEISAAPPQMVQQERASLQGAQVDLGGLCQEVAKAASKLQGVNRITQDFIESGRRMLEAWSKAEKEVAGLVATPGTMKPAPTTRSTTATAGEIAGPRKGGTSMETVAGIRDMRRIDGEAGRQKSAAIGELQAIRRDMGTIKVSLGRIAPGSAVPDRDKQCLSKAAQELEREAAVLQDLSAIVKAQQEEFNSRLHVLQVETSSFCRICELSRCRECCEKKHPIHALEGSPARAAQEKALSECLKLCDGFAEFCRDLARLRDRQAELWGEATGILKTVSETSRDILGNIRG